jgi:O-antigen/teichoic acid export membrane protein
MSSSQSSKWIKSGIYSLSSRLSLLFLGFGSFFFLIRHLSKAEFGVWSLFLVSTTIIEMSRNGLIQNALIKLVHSSRSSDLNGVITSSLVINAVYTLVVYVVLLLVSGFVEQSMGMTGIQSMFMLYGVSMILLIPFSQFNYLEQSRFSFKGIFYSSLVRQGVFFLFVVIVFFLNLNVTLLHLVILQSISILLGLLVAYYFARKVLRFEISWDYKIVKQALAFGKYVMGTNVFSLLFKSTDQFVIGYFLNAESVAIYSSAMRLSNLIEYPATSVAEVSYPHSTSRISVDGEAVIKTIYEKTVGLTLAIVLPIVIVTFLFSNLIISIIAGTAYAEASLVLRVLILFGLLIPFNRQFGMVMDSTGRPHINFRLLVFGFVLNLGLNVLMVFQFGILGAAYATLLSYSLISVVGLIILRKIFRINLFEIFYFMGIYYKRSFDFVKNLVWAKR